MLPRTVPILAAALLVGLACTRPAQAFSYGSPICEVQSLPLVEMSPTLATPPPTGWSLRIEKKRYSPGLPMRVSVVNTDPTKRARGLLVWAKSGPETGIGVFTGDPDRFQTIPSALADCGEWAISHVTSASKPQDILHVDWTAPAGATANVLFRAFVIEACGAPNGCRAYQALTPIVVKQAGLFDDDFEPAD